MHFVSYFLLLSSLLFSASPKITATMSIQELNKLTASDGSMDNYFGISTAIDGSTLVVGASGFYFGKGKVYVYEYNTLLELYEEVAQLEASDGTYDAFGWSVAISGDTIVVGGLFGDDSVGFAYLFEKPLGGWVNTNQSVKLTASDGAKGDQFGYSVGISGDTVVVGAHGDDDFGELSGAAYLYEKPASGWEDANQSAKLTASDGAERDSFGVSIGISGDTIVVGAHGDDDMGTDSGSAYLFEKPLGGWVNTTQSAKLTASDGAEYDDFAYSVAISGDTIVVGANGDDDMDIGSGSAYLFEKPLGDWEDANQSAKLTASDGDYLDHFGRRVAISGDTIVVGVAWDDDFGDASGSAYLYKKPAAGWTDATQSAKLTASDGDADDQFGHSVGISGDTIVVGTVFDDNDELGDDSGSAYVFKAKPSAINPAIIMYLLN